MDAVVGLLADSLDDVMLGVSVVDDRIPAAPGSKVDNPDFFAWFQHSPTSYLGQLSSLRATEVRCSRVVLGRGLSHLSGSLSIRRL